MALSLCCPTQALATTAIASAAPQGPALKLPHVPFGSPYDAKEMDVIFPGKKGREIMSLCARDPQAAPRARVWWRPWQTDSERRKHGFISALTALGTFQLACTCIAFSAAALTGPTVQCHVLHADKILLKPLAAHHASVHLSGQVEK
jgi:hypothetical protein